MVQENVSLLRIDAVCARRGRARTQTYADVRAGILTPPVKAGQLSLWPSNEIDALIAAEIGGAAPEDLQALVRDLVAARGKAAAA